MRQSTEHFKDIPTTKEVVSTCIKRLVLYIVYFIVVFLIMLGALLYATRKDVWYAGASNYQYLIEKGK